ncbi:MULTISPECIES: hypothetical protein [unclassified Microbacterium]|uniref:hypothetical protein n=1 Tax=unclassified Microbacterium TaxID=2609290 RepID=UPI003017143B
MSGQTWTPAPKKGIIPLHPLTFGMLLGKAFAALRHNPKVLFGFAVGIQFVVVIITALLMGLVFFTTFSRVMTLSPSSPDYEAVVAGTFAINLIAGLVVGLASVAFTAMMQGVVAAEVGYAAVGVKASLRMLWRRMAPAFWRLVGFSALALVAVFVLFAIVGVILVGLVAGGGGSGELIGVAVLVVFLFGLGCIPLGLWLVTKLLLVPSILVLEHARLRDAIVRSWRLTRGRFWVALGVTVLIYVMMWVAAQVVSVPFALFSSLLFPVIAPTGSDDPAAIIGFLVTTLASQIVLLVIQAITLVVQSTGSALIYLDCRMRYEGLDQTLIAYVERRDLGWTDEQQDDPFRVDPARAVTSAPPPRQVPEYVMATQGYAYPQYGAPSPAGQQYPPQQPYQGQAYPQAYPAQPYPPQPYPGQAYPAQPYPAHAAPVQGAASPQPAPSTAQPTAAFPPPPPPATTSRAVPPSAPAPDGGWSAPGADDPA